MKKLNLIAGICSLSVSVVLGVAATVLGDVSMWPDIVITACMGILCLTTALDK